MLKSRSFIRKSTKVVSQSIRSITSSDSPSTLIPISYLQSDEEHGKRDKFVPITRQTLKQNILSYGILTPNETKFFNDFTAGLDVASSRSLQPELIYLKDKYDLLNPDQDSKWMTRQFEERKRKENEFWFLQRLEIVMGKAHFRKLTKEEIVYALSEHERGGVNVSVDLTNYATLQFWALGQTEYKTTRLKTFRKWKQKLFGFFSSVPPDETGDFYKRVVIAMRPHNDPVLYLKAFKDVPTKSIEQLLPNGKIRMGKWDKYMLFGSIGIGGSSLLLRSLSTADKWGNINVSWVLGGISAFVLYQGISQYINRKNMYLLKISQMLYYKSIANNRGLITLLINRAEDEFFKELLLVYVTLLSNRPLFYVPGDFKSHIRNQSDTHLQQGIPVDHLPPPTAMTQQEIDSYVVEWLHKMTGKSNILFESASAIKLMQSIDVITSEKINGTVFYKAQPLSTAVDKLPKIEMILDRTDVFQVEEEQEIDDSFIKQQVNETLKDKILHPSSTVKSIMRNMGQDELSPRLPDWGRTDIRIPAILKQTLADITTIIKKRYKQWKNIK